MSLGNATDAAVATKSAASRQWVPARWGLAARTTVPVLLGRVVGATLAQRGISECRLSGVHVAHSPTILFWIAPRACTYLSTSPSERAPRRRLIQRKISRLYALVNPITHLGLLSSRRTDVSHPRSERNKRLANPEGSSRSIIAELRLWCKHNVQPAKVTGLAQRNDCGRSCRRHRCRQWVNNLLL